MTHLAEGTDTRREYIIRLNKFIRSSSAAIKQFTEEIGWTTPPADTTARGTQIHSQIKRTPEAEEVNDYSEEPLLVSSESSPSIFSVRIDAEKQKNLLLPYNSNAQAALHPPPASAGELTANFTREERLALYEHTLKVAAPVAVPPELLPVKADSSDSHPKELSGLELKKAMRDAKRRRQAYRTKVSTKNKSQIEITREIIHSMMGVLGWGGSDWLDTASVSSGPSCNPDGRDSHCSDKPRKSSASAKSPDRDSVRMRDISLSKHQEHRMRNEQESYRSRNSEETVRDKEYSKTYSEQSSKKEIKCNVKYDDYEVKGFNMYSSRHKEKNTNRESEQRRSNKRKKSSSESEHRHNGHDDERRGRRDGVLEKHDKARRQHRESSSAKFQKKDKSESDCRYEYHSKRESGQGSRHSKSKEY